MVETQATLAPLRNPDSIPTGAALAFERECITFFSDVVQMLGLPRSMGQIYGLLFACPHPLSFTDIAERLNLSKGSVSQGLRALREVGAIRPDDTLRGRREHFVPETELRKLFSGFLRGSVEPHLKRGARRLHEFKLAHGSALGAQGETGRLLLARLGKLQGWNRKGSAVLPLLTKFLG